MSKTPNYQKKASADYVARMKAKGLVRFSAWIPPHLIQKVKDMIKGDK